MQNNLSRVGKIGASQISGLVKEYADALLERNIIDGEFYRNLQEMPSYLETRYSLAHKLTLDEKQNEEFQKFIENDAMRRGKACEEMVMQQFLNQSPGFEVFDSQVRVEKQLVGVDIPLITTLDYIIGYGQDARFIHECKTTDISRFYDVTDCPFNYWLQLQMQMEWNRISSGYVTIAGVQTISKGRGKGKEYQILDHQSFLYQPNKMAIDAITQSVFWFDHELKNTKEAIFNKPQEEKTKADLEIDAFIEDFTGTKEETADAELSKKIARYQELKPLIQEFKSLDEEIKSEIKNLMGVSRKLKVSANSFEINAKYTKPSFFDEDAILEKIKKAEKELDDSKQIEIGTPKSKPSLRWEVEERT